MEKPVETAIATLYVAAIVGVSMAAPKALLVVTVVGALALGAVYILLRGKRGRGSDDDDG